MPQCPRCKNEVSKLIDEIPKQIHIVEKKRSATLRGNVIIWSVIVVLLLGLAGSGVITTSNAVDEIQTTEQSWTYLVEEYKAGNVANAEQARINIINAMLQTGNSEDAEEFFITSCMGQIQDMKCASAIVKFYNDTPYPEGARNFVDKCTDMRHGSDKDKLYNLIK